MITDDYRTYLEERFHGEVYGEAAFGALAEACTDPARARKLRTLEQLERETKERLAAALLELGSQAQANAEQVDATRAAVAGLANAPWTDFLVGMQKELEGYVSIFERAEQLAPRGQEALVRHLTAHEKALLEFTKREIAGDVRGDSLAPIIALLRSSVSKVRRFTDLDPKADPNYKKLGISSHERIGAADGAPISGGIVFFRDNETPWTLWYDELLMCHHVQGRFEVEIDAEVRELAPGDMMRIPAGTSAIYRAIGSATLFFAVTPPDWADRMRAQPTSTD